MLGDTLSPQKTLKKEPGTMYRKSENKAKSAKKFNTAKGKTRKANVMVMRGGYRL